MHGNLIRFRSKGYKGYHIFDIVVIKKGKRMRGDFIEKLGFFNPNIDQHIFFLDVARLGFWLNKGAIIHGSLKRYLFKFCI